MGFFDRDSRSNSGRISRFGAHVPVPGRPCASACSAARSAPGATFFASSWAAMEKRLPRLPPRWGQPPEQELLLQVLPSLPRFAVDNRVSKLFCCQEREKRSRSNDEPRRKGKNRGKATLSGPCPKTMENRSPTVWASKQYARSVRASPQALMGPRGAHCTAQPQLQGASGTVLPVRFELSVSHSLG